jgi:Tol biopolymer transport system component
VIDDRTVAFVSDSAGQLDIAYLDFTRPGDSVVGALVTTPDNEKAPFVVGEKCYFVSDADGIYQVMSGARPKVRAQRIEAQSITHCNWPHLSKDGRRMLYSVLNARGVYEVWMRDYQSGGEYRLVEGQRARWSPTNADEFVFTRRDSGVWTINKCSINGSAVMLNLNGADNFDPEFSPDGKYIAYTSNKNGSSDIWIMRADGSDANWLDNHGAVDCQPVWTPDGRSLIFTSSRSGSFDLWRFANLELRETATETAATAGAPR